MQRRQGPAARKSRGVAIIIMMTILVLALTTYIVSMSPNLLKTKRVRNNAAVLDLTLQALTGYALVQTAPGSLPCPDTTGDGLANPVGVSCSSQLGLLPTRTLGLDALTDATGAVLWYAVSLEYLGNAATTKNSSLASTLTLDGDPVAAVIIAPGEAINSQARNLISASDFLEGVNADANLSDYVTVIDDTQNDQLLSLETATLWSLVELRATEEASALLENYRSSCGEYPWAAAFGGPYTSVASQQSGSVPFTSALPWDWNTVCPFGTAPVPSAWLSIHWASELQYRMCTFAEGNCVTVLNSSASPAAGAVIAPGPSLTGQIRPGLTLGDYFEDENSNGSSVDFKYLRTIEHTATFNDTTTPLTP